MPVTPQALRLQHQLDAQLQHVVDQEVRDLTAAWVRAWDETAGDLDDAIQLLLRDAQTGIVAKALVTRNTKLLAALDYIGRRLTTLARDAGVRIVGDVRGVVQTAATAQAAIIGAQLPAAAPVDLQGTVLGSTIDAIVARTATQITSQTFPLAPDAYDAMQRELLRGVVVGTNPKHTAERIMDRAEQRFNGSLSRAITIARTEQLDAHRAGAAASQQAHADVLTGWTWLTHLTPTTCRSCIAQNGTVHPLSEPGPLDHQCGRCARVPKTKSWAELGIEGMDEPPDVTPDAEAWFNALTVEQQQKILGRDGYAAWNAGRWPMSEWSTVRHTPGWRDSHVPAKPPV